MGAQTDGAGRLGRYLSQPIKRSPRFARLARTRPVSLAIAQGFAIAAIVFVTNVFTYGNASIEKLVLLSATCGLVFGCVMSQVNRRLTLTLGRDMPTGGTHWAVWLSHPRVIFITSAGSLCIAIGAFSPWIRAFAGTVPGLGGQVFLDPSMTLKGLGASEWIWVYLVLAVLGIPACSWFRDSPFAAATLFLVGCTVVLSTYGIVRTHGDSFPQASIGAWLTAFGGLVIGGVGATTFCIRVKRSFTGTEPLS